jgi:hypothetical protein
MSQPKYRAACDQCSANKTKCTQERPTCARCQAMKKECHYSKSMRCGKPPRARRLLLARDQSTAKISPRGTTTGDASSSSSNASTCNLDPSEASWDNSTAAWPVFMDDGDGSEQVVRLDLGPASRGDSVASYSALQYPDPFLAFADMDFLADMDGCCPEMDAADDAEDSTMQDTATMAAHAGTVADCLELARTRIPPSDCSPTSSSRNSDGCMQETIETLTSLFELSRAGGSENSSEEKAPSVDQVLRTNVAAVQKIKKLLACPCEKDFHLPILIAVAISKALTWYQAIVSIRDPQTELLAGGRAVDGVTDRPLALGTYQLDEKTSWMMKNQLVLTPLREMLEITAEHQSRFCGATHEGTLAGLGERLYAGLGGFLRSRVEETIREIESRLNAGK